VIDGNFEGGLHDAIEAVLDRDLPDEAFTLAVTVQAAMLADIEPDRWSPVRAAACRISLHAKRIARFPGGPAGPD
jgi:hypothetical protein